MASEFEVRRSNHVIHVRVAAIILIVIVVSTCLILDLTNDVRILVALVGVIIGVALFIEPVIRPITKLIYHEESVVDRIDIYTEVIDQISNAEEIVRFKTPTTSWGSYSEGLHVFEKTSEIIKQATSRGVKVQIIADIWDWERAKFAQALMKCGAEVRYMATTQDYALITDNKSLFVMGTEISPKRVGVLDRQVKQLQKKASLITNDNVVQKATQRFEEDWDSTSAKATNKKINDYLTTACPHCKEKSEILFENSKINLT